MLTSDAEAVQIAGVEHAQRLGAVRCHTPAKLLFSHETVEDNYIRGQLFNPGVEAAGVDLHSLRRHTQCLQIERVRTRLGS